MMNKSSNQELFNCARQEVIDLHIQIENLFHNQVQDEKRLPFLTYFHPNFTMIQPNGLFRDFSWFRKWFYSAAGTRPEVKITIKQFRNIFACVDNVIISYEEHQQVTTIESLRRLSTAILIPTNNPQQPLLWRHVSETWINNDD